MNKLTLGAAALSIFALTSVHAETLDFETLSAGQNVTNETVSGVTLTVDNQGIADGTNDPRQLMVFDADCGGGPASNCSGGDSDLFFPGFANIVIISEDNDGNDPDDSAAGGDIFFDFSTPITAISVDVLDPEDGGPNDNWVTLFLGATQIDQIFVTTGNNELTTALFDQSLVADRIQVHLEGSGAVGELSFTPVPLPASIPMFLLGLLGTFAVRKNT